MQTKKLLQKTLDNFLKKSKKLFLKYNDEWEIPKFGKVCASLFALQTPKKSTILL